MIVNRFNNGWGDDWPLKQYEHKILTQYLRPMIESSKKFVIINSVWYSRAYHQQVCHWLSTNDWDEIILIAMLDAAIPLPEWYQEFNRPVTGVGYYPGPGALDFCALFVDEFVDLSNYGSLANSTAIDCAYMCLMRKPHGHRKKLFWQLQRADLLKQGLVSMGSNDGKAWHTLNQDCEPDNFAPNAEVTHYGVPNDIVSLGNVENWQRHFVNIVAETFWDINRNNFVSEKIYKPIVGQRPFLVFDPDGATKWLTDRKFEPYVNDFSDICDLDLTYAKNLVPFLTVLCQQTDQYWKSKFIDLQHKIQYNKNRFREYIDELNGKIKQGIPCQL
jgi:hypothetical protein